MVRTRVGYTGGTTPAPTYESIGDHTEAIQIDFDPSVLSLKELLNYFWTQHDPCRPAYSQQYKAAIWVENDAQKQAAMETAAEVSKALGRPIKTEILTKGTFTLAEGYHQKWRLRHDKKLLAHFQALYPTLEEFLDAPSVTRANAFVGGDGSAAAIEKDLPRLGLSEEWTNSLRRHNQN